tara:strand:- start:1127 stop:1663 length:537 start_codon:yes stop_codon:yes gene_type:complete
MFKNKKTNKKAQTGTTLTWFVAFLIIVFIITLFVTATFILAARKNIPLFGWREKIKLVGGEVESLEAQRTLDVFLNFQTKEDQNMKDLIISSVNENKDSNKEFSELNTAIDGFFQDLGVIWKVEVSLEGDNYLNEKKGKCISKELSVSRKLFNKIGKSPKEILVSLKFCNGVEENKDE